MIILIENAVAELEALSASHLEMLIHELVSCTVMGNHLLIVDRKTCDFLMKSASGELQRATVQSWKNFYTQYAGLVDAVDIYIQVSYSGDTGRAMQATIETIISGLLRSPTILLTENHSRDGALLEIMLRQVRRRRSHPDLNLFLDNGGGHTIIARVPFWTERSALVVTVVDSDRTTPGMPQSETIRNLTALFERYPFGDLLVLPCHELENLLSQPVIALLPQWQSYSAQAVIIAMGDEWAAGTCDFWTYFDFKAGIDASEALALASRGDRGWLEDKSRKYGVAQVPGFGAGLIGAVLQSGEAISEMVTHIGKQRFQTEYGDYFSRLEEWFIATPPLRL